MARESPRFTTIILVVVTITTIAVDPLLNCFLDNSSSISIYNCLKNFFCAFKSPSILNLAPTSLSLKFVSNHLDTCEPPCPSNTANTANFLLSCSFNICASSCSSLVPCIVSCAAVKFNSLLSRFSG